MDVRSLWNGISCSWQRVIGSIRSVHVEHLGQRYGHWAVVWVCLHDVCHVCPPFLADVCAAEILAATFSFELLVGVEDIGVFIEVYAVVAHSAFGEQGFEFGKEVGMATLVLFFVPWFEVHLERLSFHCSVIG